MSGEFLEDGEDVGVWGAGVGHHGPEKSMGIEGGDGRGCQYFSLAVFGGWGLKWWG